MSLEGGPWGIVIVVSAFMIQFFIFGVAGCLGVYNIEFLEYFQASAAEVSVVYALHFGMLLGGGPIVSFLMAKFGYRKTVLGGNVLVVLGLLVVPFFPNLYMLYLTIGVLVGFGGSCAYIPSHTLSGLYYDKYRSLATGVVTSGSGLGITVMPIIVAYFIEVYSWRGSFIIFAGLCLHVFIFGALLRNPPPAVVLPDSTKVDGNKAVVSITNDESLNENKKKSSLIIDEELSTELPPDDVSPSPRVFRSVHLSDEEYSRCDNSSTKIDESDDVCRIENESLLRLKNQTETHIDEYDELPETARHIYIFKDYNFVVYFVNNILWNASLSMANAFLPEYYRTLGFSLQEGSWLVGVAGFGSCLGGILGGVLGNIKHVNRIYLYIVSCCLLGVLTLIIPSEHAFAYLAVVNFLFGLTTGIILGLLVVVLADLVGVKSLGNGMGYLMFANGLGAFVGPILSGILIDHTGSEESNIYMSGIGSVVAGVFMCLIPLRHYYCVKGTEK